MNSKAVRKETHVTVLYLSHFLGGLDFHSNKIQLPSFFGDKLSHHPIKCRLISKHIYTTSL